MSRDVKTYGAMWSLIAVMFGTCGVAPHLSRDTLTVQVESKDAVPGEAGGGYLIWTTGGEVFSLDDSILEGNWDTSDDYGGVHEGGCYTFHVYGWRVPFLSMYRNIYQVDPADCE